MTELIDDENVNQAMINSRPSQKCVIEEKSQGPTSQDLALIRTYLACERTFLASTRTNAIFAGLSLLLSNLDQYVPAMIILSLCILVNVSSTYIFYQSSYKSKYLNNLNDKALHLASPIFYSLLLIIILIILLWVI